MEKQQEVLQWVALLARTYRSVMVTTLPTLFLFAGLFGCPQEPETAAQLFANARAQAIQENKNVFVHLRADW